MDLEEILLLAILCEAFILLDLLLGIAVMEFRLLMAGSRIKVPIAPATTAQSYFSKTDLLL